MNQYAPVGNSGYPQTRACDRGRRDRARMGGSDHGSFVPGSLARRSLAHGSFAYRSFARALSRGRLAVARVWPLGSVIVAGTVCLAPAPAAAACDREVDLASAVAHAGQGQVAAAGDKFALARTQCGDAVLGGRDAALDASRRANRASFRSIRSPPARRHRQPASPRRLRHVVAAVRHRWRPARRRPPHRPASYRCVARAARRSPPFAGIDSMLPNKRRRNAPPAPCRCAHLPKRRFVFEPSPTRCHERRRDIDSTRCCFTRSRRSSPTTTHRRGLRPVRSA